MDFLQFTNTRVNLSGALELIAATIKMGEINLANLGQPILVSVPNSKQGHAAKTKKKKKKSYTRVHLCN